MDHFAGNVEHGPQDEVQIGNQRAEHHIREHLPHQRVEVLELPNMEVPATAHPFKVQEHVVLIYFRFATVGYPLGLSNSYRY